MFGIAFDVMVRANAAGICCGDGSRTARRPHSQRCASLPPASLSVRHVPEHFVVASAAPRPGRAKLHGRCGYRRCVAVPVAGLLHGSRSCSARKFQICRFCPTSLFHSVFRHKSRTATLGGHCRRGCTRRLPLDKEAGAVDPCGRPCLRHLWVGSVWLEGKFRCESLASQAVLCRPETLLAWWILRPVGDVGECPLAHGSRSWGYEGCLGRRILASCRLCCICSPRHLPWGCRPDGCALHFRHRHHRVVLSTAPSRNLCCPMRGHRGSGVIAERRVGGALAVSSKGDEAHALGGPVWLKRRKRLGWRWSGNGVAAGYSGHSRSPADPIPRSPANGCRPAALPLSNRLRRG